ALGLAAAGCYVAFVLFSLERLVGAKRWLVAISFFLAAAIALRLTGETRPHAGFVFLNELAGAALLGASMAAMLLGHYYLTAPWMSLRPLYRLIAGIGLAAAVRGVLEASRLAGAPFANPVSLQSWMDWVFYA